jgi:hypothetical protein
MILIAGWKIYFYIYIFFRKNTTAATNNKVIKQHGVDVLFRWKWKWKPLCYVVGPPLDEFSTNFPSPALQT